MGSRPAKRKLSPAKLEKAPSGISGLDRILDGGLPKGRSTLVCGSAGCGKTLMATEFLVRGAIEHGEPGVFLAFEETPDDLTRNVASLGFDLETLIAQKKLAIDHVYVDRSSIEEAGEYDLEALFVRIGYAIDAVGAKRVAIDTLEVLFAGLTNHAILRSELRRLFRWLKDRGMTAIITAERGEGVLTRHGIEEYVSDCVLLLDHRVSEQVSTRRMRVVKYRGSTHQTNEYPFIIDRRGFSVLPITSVGLDHTASNERVSTGIKGLDEMLGGRGIYRGNTLLITGTPGTGKTTVASHFVEAACRRGERALMFLFEESPRQLERNMRSIGVDLLRWHRKGLLAYHAARPSSFGLESHLAEMVRMVDEFEPAVVTIDPITSLRSVAQVNDVRSMLIRFIDYLRSRGITALFTSLTLHSFDETSDAEISSIVDVWLLVRDVEANGERNRTLYLIKARGLAHSNQVREFLMTSGGVRLIPAYVGPAGVLTGTARLTQEARDREQREKIRIEIATRRRAIREKQRAVKTQITELRSVLNAQAKEVEALNLDDEQRIVMLDLERKAIARLRTNGSGA